MSPEPGAQAAASPRVLVVDDALAMAEAVASGLRDHGYQAVCTDSGRDAAGRLESGSFDALVTDLRMPEVDGLQLLALSRKVAPDRPVIIMTAFSAVDSAVEAIRQGASHYLTKPFKVAELALFLERALEESRLRREAAALRTALRQRFSLANLIGREGALREVCDLVERLADSKATVLITGETGTGKGLIARALHAGGRRATAPFVMVNCAAIPDALFESELFGHVKGAFTGALTARKGLFAEASGGTLFLDEVGELAPGTQAKLLQVLEREVTRAVGSDRETPTDVRIVAATNVDLRRRVAAGTFREDLLFRLDVVRLGLPPLRARSEDLPALIAHFLAASRARHPESRVARFSAPAMASLLAYPWPGNVRELENAIERVVLLAAGEVADLVDLPEAVRGGSAGLANRFDGGVVPLRTLEHEYARWALGQLGGRKRATAERLGIDPKTLGRLLEELPEEPEDP